jgi:DNA adenine methylase
MQFNTPLRYPGGKGRLSQFIIDLIEMNELGEVHYVEPYAGGAGIAITLLYLEYASHVHLNDLDPSVFSFWSAVLQETEALCKLVADTPLTMDEWYRQRDIQRASDPDRLKLAFSTFFLNRTNRSGIIRGGVIGGKGQTGSWKLDARFNRKELIQRIEKVARYSPRISIYNLDAAEFIAGPLNKIPPSGLVYLDPPYYSKGDDLYRNRYQHLDHAAIASMVPEIKQKWIVSYDNAEGVRELYTGHRQQTFGLRYSAQSRYEGQEVMIFCPSLKIPGAIEPWRGIAA